MAKIAMYRVDWRMAHGQVAGVWSKALNAKKIYIFNDYAAGDKSLVRVMNASMPNCKVVAYPVDRINEVYAKDNFGKGNVIVLFRTPEDAYRAFKLGFPIPELNVGQVPGGPETGRVLACDSVCLSKEELDWLTEMSNAGTKVYTHQSLGQNYYDFDAITAAVTKNLG